MEKKPKEEDVAKQIIENNTQSSIYKEVVINITNENENSKSSKNSNQIPQFIQEEIIPKNKEEEKRIQDFFQLENPLIKKHKNIVTLINKSYENEVYYFLYQYTGKTLTQYLNERKTTFSEKELQSFTRQLLNGLYILTHFRKINCCVLSPDNIYVEVRDNTIIPKIKYCNVEYILKKSLSKENFEYLSPEELEKENDYYDPLNPYTLFWSLGALIYKLFFGYTPFSQIDKETTKEDLIKRIDKGNYFFSLEKDISLELVILIKNLLISNPLRRLNWEEIQKSPFLIEDCSKFHILKQTKQEMINLNIYDPDRISYYFFSEIMELKKKTLEEIKNISIISNIKESNLFGSKIDFGD